MPESDSELFKVRERLHRLNDTVQKHELTLAEQNIKIDQHDRQLMNLMTQTATRGWSWQCK